MTLPNLNHYVAQKSTSPLLGTCVKGGHESSTSTEDFLQDEGMVNKMIQIIQKEESDWDALIEEVDAKVDRILAKAKVSFTQVIEEEDANMIICRIKRQREDEMIARNEKKVKHTASEKRLSRDAVASMRRWLLDNHDNPYPSDEQKQRFADGSGLTLSQVKPRFNSSFFLLTHYLKQVNTWFTNARRRILKPSQQSKVSISNHLRELLQF